VQRDHVSLIRCAVESLQPNGIIYFSNNLRSFKLADADLSDMGLTIENISAQTLPEDFQRNPKIHQCWRLTKC
jgi:23S rRNA (guanine2445-N2)-methyltransferase / 23S rRNA (guanine2069-N7)-methyltransferase